MKREIKIALIVAGALLLMGLSVVVFTCPFVRTTGMVVKGHTSVMNIQVPGLNEAVNEALGEKSSRSSDPLLEATCDVYTQYTVRFYPLGNEKDYVYRAQFKTKYDGSGKYGKNVGDRVELLYNPINPDIVRIIQDK